MDIELLKVPANVRRINAIYRCRVFAVLRALRSCGNSGNAGCSECAVTSGIRTRISEYSEGLEELPIDVTVRFDLCCIRECSWQVINIMIQFPRINL